VTGFEDLPYRPSFPPDYRPGIGIVGCGHIVKTAHLPAYADYGCTVVGVYDPVPKATAGVREQFGVRQVFESLDALLADPEIEVVDIATPPAVRPRLVREALAAGKHVLAQKPLAEDVGSARELVDDAERRGLRLAVNQNARWSPPWRIATLLIEHGAIGDVFSVTHLLDRDFRFVIDVPHYDEIEHLLLYDHSVHWIDISRCWFGEKRPISVRALEYRTPGQPPETKAPWGAWIAIQYADGSSATVRSSGGSRTTRPGCPFWIHGTEGTIRGSLLLGSDFVELERDDEFLRYPLEGAWYTAGFAGAMGELLSAVAEDREPYNSARHNLLSLELTLAACRSAEEDGRPVSLEEIS
jgi:predicted dehydrogenase